MKKIDTSKITSLFFETIDKIGKLSKLYKILLCLGLFVLLVGPFVYFSFVPKISKISVLKKEHTTLETRLAKAKAKANQLKHYQAKLKEAEMEFKIKKYPIYCQVYPNPVVTPVWNSCCFSRSLKKLKIFMLKSPYQ
jgi:Tfp pilus assembly protein PilO